MDAACERDKQTCGRAGTIVVRDETVLTCKSRYHRGRGTRATWWAHGGVELVFRVGGLGGRRFSFLEKGMGG